MNEYILPVKYQGVGCGISVIVAGLEQDCRNYKEIKISINWIDYISTEIDSNNIDFSNIVTFDNLTEDKYYTIYAEITMIDDSIKDISAKIPSQLQTATVELPLEMRMKNYIGGGLSTEAHPIEVVF